MLGPDGKPAPKFARVKGRLPPQLVRCPGCGQHLFPTARNCPHCKGNLAAMARKERAAIRKAEKALATLKQLFGDS
jgi:hypothetical protein